MHLISALGRLLVVGSVILSSFAAPAGALASCLAPPSGVLPWANADAVFVGMVTGLTSRDRWATVSVEEIWQGPDQPAEVVVRGGPEGDAATSVDRTFTLGTRYIFAVTIDNGTLLDSACSGTTDAATLDLKAMRPAEVRQPGGGTASSRSGLDLAWLVGPLGVVGIVGGLLLVTVLLVRRREA